MRTLYHHRCTTPLPRVVVGIPDSWDSSVAISNADHASGSSAAWSQCGQFVAIRTREAVEIRDALTFGLLFTLQQIEPTSQLTGAPTYSPDGRYLACASDSTIIIWDIQTGGVAKVIQCDKTYEIPPVWSSDGGVIGAVVWDERTTRILTIRKYDVASGTALPHIMLKSQDEPRLWANGKSFQVMTTARRGMICVVYILEAEPTPAKSESFTISLWERDCQIGSFSPTARRISVSASCGTCRLRIFDIRNSRRLLDRRGKFTVHSFSPEGGLFAASLFDSIHIWKYNGDYYASWRILPSLDSSSPSLLLFSPTSTSILGHFADTHRLWRLDSPSTAPTTYDQDHELTFFSRSGTYMATASRGGRTVAITDLLSRTRSQLINTNMDVMRFALTGNVLLVTDHRDIRAWRLTEEGKVYGYRHIWTEPLQNATTDDLTLFVDGQIAIVECCGRVFYDTITGELQKLGEVPPRYRFYSHPLTSQTLNYFRDDCTHDNPSGESWEHLTTVLEGGWIRGLGGVRQFWLPVEWRAKAVGEMDWCSDISVIRFLAPQGGPVIIKLMGTRLSFPLP